MPHSPSLYAQAPPYCHYYFDLVESDDLLREFEKNLAFVQNLIRSIPAEKAAFAYAEGKWTIKEVLRHIIETERIYAYRALRFSRSDSTELPGFEENAYIDQAKDMQYDLKDLEAEFTAVRMGSICLYKSMTESMLDFQGVANKVNYTPRSIGFMIVGHTIHHCRIIQERYS